MSRIGPVHCRIWAVPAGAAKDRLREGGGGGGKNPVVGGLKGAVCVVALEVDLKTLLGVYIGVHGGRRVAYGVEREVEGE